jgi:hypothetical protein
VWFFSSRREAKDSQRKARHRKRLAISLQSSARQKNTAAFAQLLTRGRVIPVRLFLFSLKADG